MFVLIRLLFLFLISIVTIVRAENSILFAQDTLNRTHGTIIHSSVLFRHGERSPIILYPNDPYTNETYQKLYWPQGKGQLTKRGKLNEYNLGKWFRKRYDFLVKEGYKYDLLRVDSSNIDRTIMSAGLFLAGFFPPAANELWSNDGLNWQPVPVRVIPTELDVILDFAIKCKAYESEKEIANNSPELRDFYSRYQETFEFMAAYSGFEMSPDNILQAMDNTYFLYDTLLNEELNNMTLPAWTKYVYPEPLKTLGGLSLINVGYTHTMRRLKAGTLIGKVVEEMESKIQGSLPASFHFYSGHDTTIAGVLMALGIFNYAIPPYSTSLFFELRQKDNDHVVTISYRNSTTSAPYLLQLPGCEDICTFENFKKLTENLIPENWQNECNLDSRERKRMAQEEIGMRKWPSDTYFSEIYSK